MGTRFKEGKVEPEGTGVGRTSPVVQWLRRHVPNARGHRLDPWSENYIPHGTHRGQKKGKMSKKKKKKKRLVGDMKDGCNLCR